VLTSVFSHIVYHNLFSNEKYLQIFSSPNKRLNHLLYSKFIKMNQQHEIAALYEPNLFEKKKVATYRYICFHGSALFENRCSFFRSFTFPHYANCKYLPFWEPSQVFEAS
jgi:hypothetical protein